MEPKPHILVVDDDDRLRALLTRFLGEQGFMTAVADAAEARRKLAWYLFDLIVLDVMMPGESGLALLASLRDDPRTPVLMLSAMGEAEDRIKGLETGAEDYLAKPFEPKELVLRIRAVLRRGVGTPEKPLAVRFGEYSFDCATMRLTRGDGMIGLTSGEAALLRLLAENAGKPVSREELCSRMPGISSERAVDVQIARLRKKIEESEGKPAYLQTVRGAGYVLYAEPAT